MRIRPALQRFQFPETSDFPQKIGQLPVLMIEGDRAIRLSSGKIGKLTLTIEPLKSVEPGGSSWQNPALPLHAGCRGRMTPLKPDDWMPRFFHIIAQGTVVACLPTVEFNHPDLQ